MINTSQLDQVSNSSIVLLFWVLSIIVVGANFIIFYYQKKNSVDNYDHRLVKRLLVCALVILLMFALITPFYNSKEKNEDSCSYIAENVKAKYGLNIIEPNKIKYYSLKDNIPSEKYYATIDHDNRIYEVYFVKNGETLSLYSKNEKGVYLPLSSLMNNTGIIDVEETIDQTTKEDTNSVE